MSLPTGYDTTNSVYTAVKVNTTCSYVNTGLTSYTPTCCFADSAKTVKSVTEEWTGMLALFFTGVVFTGTSSPTIISTSARRIA